MALGVSHTQETTFQGPLPPPALLEHYERVTPGLADRIVKMAEDEALHRRALENGMLETAKQEQKNHVSEAHLGQIFGFFIGVIAIVCGAYAAIAGQPWAGGFIGGGGVVGLVTAFIIGRRSEQRTE